MDEPAIAKVALPDAEATTAEPGAPGLPRCALLATTGAGPQGWGKNWLELAGFEVYTTSDGAEAVKLFNVLRPEVAVVDSSMCDAHGLDLASAIRRIDGDNRTPLVVLCADDEDVRIALSAGASDVARSPLNWELISRRADYLAHMTSTDDELRQTREELQASRRCIRETASSDTLTGLPGREKFTELLAGALQAGAGRDVAVLMIDFDQFREINHTQGREMGDDVLKQAASRLRQCVHATSLLSRQDPVQTNSAVARLSGDEFTLMLTGLSRRGEVEAVARSLSEVLNAPYDVNNDEVFLSSSVGIAMAPHDGHEAEELLQHAELALVKAKQAGGGMIQIFERQAEPKDRRILIAKLLRSAIERGEMSLHYQPQVDAVTQRITGAEALLRWHSGELGQVPPAEFVPIAEECGLMVPIGAWVMRRASRQLREWIDDGLPRMRMAMNISVSQLQRADLAATIRQVLERTGLPPGLLEVELSERGVFGRDPRILKKLTAIKQLGVRISVDDFGTGDSAIAYLRRFPLDGLKIDRSYVDSVEICESSAAITSATIAMAQQLNLEVVAEGVETPGQLEFIRARGADLFQGFLFSRPVPPEEFRSLVQKMRPEARPDRVISLCHF